jgi:hypothetical protein
MNIWMMKKEKIFPFIITAIGILMVIIGIIVQYIGGAKQPEIVLRQIILILTGFFIIFCGWKFSKIKKNGEILFSTEKSRWPSFKEAFIASFSAFLIVIVDIYFSMSRGLLANPPVQDGITYMIGAKITFLNLYSFFQSPILFLKNNFVIYSPFEKLLMIIHFFLFGEGEVQAYSVRFWPIFLLLLLVIWVIRKRSNLTVALVAMIFTAFLPTISVGLRATISEFLTGQTLQYYLSDLRPDLLFVVLILWMSISLIENVYDLDIFTFLVSGFFLSFAILTKPSGILITLVVWVLSMGFVFLINRNKIKKILSISVFNLLPFMIIVVPWILLGGIEWVYIYLTSNYGSPLYTTVNSSLLAEITYYWGLFPQHMGYIEGGGILFLGICILIYLLVKKGFKSLDLRIIAYLGISGILFLGVVILPNENYFLGLPYYLFLWIFSWIMISSLFVVFWKNMDALMKILIGIVIIYSVLLVSGGFFALHELSITHPSYGYVDRDVTIEIAKDLKDSLTKNDSYEWVPLFGYPVTLEYYMADSDGNYPNAFFGDNQTLEECKAVLIYRDVQTYKIKAYAPNVTYPFWYDIYEQVHSQNSSFVLTKTYTTSDGTMIELYLNKNNTSL